MLEKRDVLEQQLQVSQKKLIVSHAPFYHSGHRITERNYHTMLAALPALLMCIAHYGIPAISVICLSISTAMIWELLFNLISKRPITIGDGNAAVLGLLFAMLVPATMPWWAVITGTFLVIVIGKQIFGGIGSNAFHPVALAIAMMLLSWGHLFDFDAALLNYDLEFATIYPLAATKYLGAASADAFSDAALASAFACFNCSAAASILSALAASTSLSAWVATAAWATATSALACAALAACTAESAAALIEATCFNCVALAAA